MNIADIPTDGAQFLLWKSSTRTSVIVAANWVDALPAIQYIEKAFDLNVKAEELNVVLDGFSNLDVTLGYKMQMGVQKLIAEKSTGASHAATHLVTRLTDLNHRASEGSVTSIGGRTWIHAVALHFKQTALTESKKAGDLLKSQTCPDLQSLGQYLIIWDKHSPQLLMEDRRILDTFLDMFQNVPQVWVRYLTMSPDDSPGQGSLLPRIP